MALSTFISTFQSFVLFGVLIVQAAPLLRYRQSDSFATLSIPQITAFRPFSFYASTAYCQPSETLTWTCGGKFSLHMSCGRSTIMMLYPNEKITSSIVNCDANPTFQPVAAGGDGVSVQFWFVGIDPTLQVFLPHKLLTISDDGSIDSHSGTSGNRSRKDVIIRFTPNITSANRTLLVFPWSQM